MISSVGDSLRALNYKCYWIDEGGRKHEYNSYEYNPYSPCNHIDFLEFLYLSEEFKANISWYSKQKDTIFLVNLTLNKSEYIDLQNRWEKGTSKVFTANVAAEIIKILKKANPEATIKVTSVIWRPGDKCCWKETLEPIRLEPWFGSIAYIPTAILAGARHYPDTMDFILSGKSWEELEK